MLITRAARSVLVACVLLLSACVATAAAAPAVQSSGGTLSLAVARNVGPLTEGIPHLELRSGSILLEGKNVGPTAPLLQEGYWNLPKLTEALGALPDNLHEIHMAIEADVPYRIVKKALLRVTNAGFNRVDFVVKDRTAGTARKLALRAIPATAKFTSSLDPVLIDRQIKTHLAAIQKCYEDSLKRDPDASGKVVVNFSIRCDGLVDHAGMKSSTLHDPTTEKCIADRFVEMHFQKPTGGGIVVVNYPLLFRTDAASQEPAARSTPTPAPSDSNGMPGLVLSSASVLSRHTVTADESCEGGAPRFEVFHGHVDAYDPLNRPISVSCATASCSVDDPAILKLLRSVPRDARRTPVVTLVVEDSVAWSEVVDAMDVVTDAGLFVVTSGSPL